MRTSVVRTTPEIGAAGAGRNRTYPPAHAATTMTPSAMIQRLAMGLPPLDQRRRHHGKREIDECQDPQPAPVAHHLPQARTQLADAHHAVDREIRGKDVPDLLHRLGYSLERPGEPRQEELRQAGAEEDQRRRLRTLEPCTD